ncbi:DEAD/DEAH box helicase family protein [Candidatus Bathyarchaeota archaeon]|nr:DEAD/DEAH box helicase family protein [Candidatus Bathyarchaeota archaeon]
MNMVKFIEHPLIWPNKIEARAYQLNIAEKACLKNTLVVLPTALGKTVISALAAAHFLYNYKHLRVLVMAPTRPLVMQHKESFMNILKLKDSDSILLTGKTQSLYRKRIWNSNFKIIFATPQVVKNDLEKNFFSLKDFSLLIFDECHRARKDYAYTYIAKKYIEQCSWPIILGLTASPGADEMKVKEICEALFIEQIEFRVESDPDVASYINPINVEWKFIDMPSEYIELSSLIKDMLNEKLLWLNKNGLIKKNLNYITRKDLLKLGVELHARLESSIDKGFIYSAIINQSAALTLFHALELLETQGIQTLKAFLEKIKKEDLSKKSFKTIVNDLRYFKLSQLLKIYSDKFHPKIQLLKNEVEKQLKAKPNSKILIFTQYRDTASYIVEQLKQNYFVERFVGQASKNGDLGLTQDKQAEILNRFRNGKTNVLIATCIAEEGLDIPSVDLVIFYEPIPSEIRYIQRKGRTGRKSAGKVVILAAKNTYDMAYLYASKRKVEKMKHIISRLNKILKPAQRLGEKPKLNPLSKEEIEELNKAILIKNN